MTIFLYSFIITLAVLNIIWWLVLDKGQRLWTYDKWDEFAGKMVAKLRKEKI
jgi:hypothetical protein